MKPKVWNGKPIAMPGWYARVPIERYHEHAMDDGSRPWLCVEPSISSGGLRKIFNFSPAHYWCTSPYNRHPNDEQDEIEVKETAAMRLGRAAHHLLLGEKAFNRLYVIRPEVRPGSLTVAWHASATECKTWVAARLAEGRAILTPNDAQRIKGMRHALAANPLVQQGILDGFIETSLVWKDKETGVWCKARPDAMPTYSGDFGDLKTTRSVRWLDLMRTFADRGFHQQAALVRRGYKEVLHLDMASFSLVFVESLPPHAVRVVVLTDGDLARGERQNRAALRIFADCLSRGKWPGPGGEREDAEAIELGDWERKRIDARLEELKA